MSGALLKANAQPAFARHETFHLRFGWLRKAFTEADKDRAVFSNPAATVRLGVGKNMVSAIRYWAQAYKVLEQAENPKRPRMPHLVPSDFGRALLADDGWDPWLEDPASLWLLHWKLLAPKSLAPVWWTAFHLFAPQQFEEHQLTDHVVELTASTGWPAVMESSIKKDVDCMLRTFAFRRYGRQTMDDLLDCPTRQLGLLAPAAGDNKSWRFVTGPKASLPPLIVAHACLDYLAEKAATDRTISIARLTGDPGSPGRAFRLAESNLYDSLVAAATELPGIQVVEPAGLRQLVLDAPAAELADAALQRHYATRERSVA
jgi:hypothetical protein